MRTISSKADETNQSTKCKLSSISIHLDLRTAIAIAMPGSILLAMVKIWPCIGCCWWIDQSMLLWRKCKLACIWQLQTCLTLENLKPSKAPGSDGGGCTKKQEYHNSPPALQNVICTADVWWAGVLQLTWGRSISWKWKWKKDNKVEIAESESGSRTTKLNTESYSWREGGARSWRDGWCAETRTDSKSSSATVVY